MEEGGLMTMSDGRKISLLWAPPEYFGKHNFNPLIRSKKSIEQEGGVKVEITLSPFGGEIPETYYCRSCRKILTDFVDH